MKYEYSKEHLEEIVRSSISFPEVCKKLGLDPNFGGVRRNIERIIKRNKIDVSHFSNVRRMSESKIRYEKSKIIDLYEKSSTIKEMLVELDLLPITSNYSKIKSVLGEYGCDLLKFDIANGRNLKSKYSKEELEKIVSESKTYRECFEKLGIRSAGANYRHLKKYISKYEIDTSHFDPYYNNVNRLSKSKINLIDLLKENVDYSRTRLKRRLFEEQILENICSLCGQNEIWNGTKISLILDHINGVHNDNRIENLRIVCPNCNAGLDTFAGRNNKKETIVKTCDCGNPMSKLASNCFKCRTYKRKVERPSIDQIIKEVEEIGYSATCRKYGVSDNAIRKWINPTIKI